jgi:hypothetical protein
MVLHFGFDLDNTLINYDLSALEYSRLNNLPDNQTMSSLRAYYTATKDSNAWAKAQSWIYTDGLEWAEVSSGATDTIQKLISVGYKISIISHKTEFGPSQYGGVPLRVAATDWITNSALIQFFPKLDNVYFTGSVREKISLIQEQKLSHYVDDLIKIFLHDAFPKHNLKSYIYKPCGKLPDWLIPLNDFKSLFNNPL